MFIQFTIGEQAYESLVSSDPEHITTLKCGYYNIQKVSNLSFLGWIQQGNKARELCFDVEL